MAERLTTALLYRTEALEESRRQERRSHQFTCCVAGTALGAFIDCILGTLVCGFFPVGFAGFCVLCFLAPLGLVWAGEM